jgi:hypothetical protein
MRGSKDYEGTGIGLALVRKGGKGSPFWIEHKCGEVAEELQRKWLGSRRGGL